MVNVDLAISVGIWVSGVAMSWIGIQITIKPPITPKSKWWYSGWFIVLAIAVVGLSTWQFERADQAARHAADERQQEQLRSEGDIKFVQGQLQTIQAIMTEFMKTGGPSGKELASAISEVLSKNQQASDLSNKQLCDRARSLATNLRSFESKFQEDRQAQWMQQDLQSRYPKNPLTPEQLSALRAGFAQQEFQSSERHANDFRNQFVGDAKYVHDLMMARIPSRDHDRLAQNNGAVETSLTMGTLVGATNAYNVSNYLDQLANALCPKTEEQRKAQQSMYRAMTARLHQFESLGSKLHERCSPSSNNPPSAKEVDEWIKEANTYVHNSPIEEYLKLEFVHEGPGSKSTYMGVALGCETLAGQILDKNSEIVSLEQYVAGQ